MKSLSWLRKVFARSTFGRMPYRKAPRRSQAPRFEQLEDRTLLSTTYTQTFAPAAQPQFSNASNDTFLGASFDPSASFGSIDSTPVGDFGAQVNVNLTGQAGLNLVFTGTGGTVSPNYNASLNQNFTQPTSFGEVVSFNPQNTNVAINSGNFSTTSPSFGYGADVIANLSGSIGGTFAFFNDYSGSFSFNGGLDVPLISVNENNDGILSVGGVPIFAASKAGDGLPSWASEALGEVQDFGLGQSLQFGISNDPPLKIATSLSASSDPAQFTQDLKLELGVPKQLGSYKVPTKAQGFKVNAAMDLGSLTEEAPEINIPQSNSTLQAGGAVTATGSGTVAQLNLQVGALAASLLGLAALGTTDSIDLPGGVKAEFTPVSFQLQPNLSATQAITVQPVSRLTYNFVVPGSGSATTNPTPTTADVILDGQDIGQQSSVTFTPGQDTVGIRFEGKPIQVDPTWSFADAITNEVDLDANLDATLTVGEISVKVPGLDPITAGPLYQQQFQFANSKLMTLFDNTTVTPSTSVQLFASPSDPNPVADDSFTIGSTFQLSTAVTTTADTGKTGSLRFAVESADAEGTTVITLGAGTYQLTQGPSASDGSNGNLLVTNGTNLIIQGAGAGQTIIQAAYTGGKTDRLFDVQGGASLTLEGVTLEDGNSANSVLAPGQGGAILGEVGSIIDVESSALINNTAPGVNESPLTLQVDGFGGAILSNGSVTVNNSTISGNSAVAAGGGIRVQGGSLLLTDSTVANNSLSGGYTDYGMSSVQNSDIGGGVDVQMSAATIEGCTFTGNVAGGSEVDAGGGAIGIFDDASNQNILIENSTLIGNRATGTSGEGGAITYFNPLAHLVLVGDTIASNVAGAGGGVVATFPEPIVLKNTIVAGNFTTLGAADDMNGLVVWSLGNNLIGTTGPSNAAILADHGTGINSGGQLVGIASGFASTDVLNADPLLASPANNGGPTQTEALGRTSPAIGAGGTTINVAGVITQLPATDQRGLARVTNGHVDIGAFQEQYDLAVTASVSGGSNGTALNYTFTVTNNGPDAAPGPAFIDNFPSNLTIGTESGPAGWVAFPSGNQMMYTLSATLPVGQSATFTATVTPTTALSQPLLDTATVTPNSHDTDTANNSATVAVQPATEGQSLQNALLYHFQTTNPADAAADFSASVSWGDGGPGNNSLDGTGTVSVVADPNGGFDVIGSHTYADEGRYSVTVNVTDLHGGTVQTNLSGQPISNGLAAPLPTPGGQVTNMVLFHFVDPGASQDPTSFTPIVSWGDGTLVTGAAGGLSVVADPAGGFDVVGSHTFASNVVAAVNLVEVKDSKGVVFWGPSLLHIQVQPLSTDPISALWGDGNGNSVNGPLGAPPLLVAGNPAGGFDIVGDHAYTKGVATYSGTALVSVADGALTGGAVTPPPVLPQTQLTDTVLYQFFDPDMNLTASDFTATVHWGGSVAINTSSDGSGFVSVVADNGGWDVVGTHSYAGIGVAAIRSVTVTDTDGRVFYSPGLFHFTDANPLATASDFTATVNWGDGRSNNNLDGNNAVFIVADPAGGFDVLGDHIYSQNVRNGTFSVSVADDGGATASASTSSFSVDFLLSAGTLTTPNVTNEGDSISNAPLFHFTDGDTQGAASDFTATVLWGDGTSNTSADKSGTVTVSANTSGGFDVFGSHTFGEVDSGSVYGVYIQDVSGATTGASSTSFTVADPSVEASGGLTLSDKENADPGAQTVATFTDPAGAEDLSDYSASIHWGDGTPDSSGTISYSSTTATFTVQGDHVYGQAGSDTITVTINHGDSTPVTVTDTASVAEVAVSLTANSISLSTVYGQSTGTQTVGTFTDAGGAGALSGYTPTIDWGDGSTPSTGTIGYDTAAPFTFASNLQTGNGPSAVAVADLNGDGTTDLVVASALDNDVEVFFGNGDGSFQTPVTYSLGTTGPTALAIANNPNAPAIPNSPTALAIANLGNGHLDIVTANANTNTVSVLLGDGTGTFGKATVLTAGTSPSALALANLGNGHLDIVTANSGDNTVSVFLGDGTGAFGKATSFAAGADPDGLAIGDVNEDTKADVVVANAGSDSVSILLGNGDGTLRAPTSVMVGATPSAVALARLSGSGPLDIVTANSGSDNVSVLVGNGDGTFQTPAVNYAVGSAPAALLVTDANGDGKPDIITANNGDNTVSVLLNNGDGTFQTQTTYDLGTGATAPVALAAADLNGAGVLDLVTANSLSNNVTLLLPPYTVTGSHSYSAVSPTNTPYQVKVTVAHGTTSTTTSTGTVAVTPAPLTITADDQTMTYGGKMPTLTATFDGLVNGDQPTAVTGLSLTTVPASSHVGDYTIMASGATDSNYTITPKSGTLHITAAPLTISADNKTMTYGGTMPGLTASYSGLVNGDTPATFSTSPNTAPTLTTTATAASHVSGNPYSITASGAADSDYSISYVAGGLTVTPAPLTITADNKTMPYGGPLPALTVSYSGLTNGDTPATFSTSPNTAPTLTTTATAASHVSGSPYSITASGAADSDYSISYVAGGLTVTPAPLTITADNKTMGFGGAVPALTVSYNGLVNGDTPATFNSSPNTAPTVMTTATPASVVGPYPITARGASDADYAIQYAPGTLTVGLATPTLTWAAPQPIASFTALSGAQLDATASVPGTFGYTPAAGTLLAAGTHTLSVSFTPSDGADYTTATDTVQIAVLGPGSIAVVGTQLYIVGGSSSNDQVQVNPVGTSNTGSTGVQVQATLNKVHIQTTYSQPFTAINVFLQGGNDNVQFANTLTVNGVVSAGNGNDTVQLGQGNNAVTLGWGNDTVQLGNGNNSVALDVGAPPSSPTPPPPPPPPGNDNVQLGNGNNTVSAGSGNVTVSMGSGSNSIALGDGNDTVQVNNPPPPPPAPPTLPAVYGNDTVTAGNGNDNIQLGQGNNTVALGWGNDNVQLGNGNNTVALDVGAPPSSPTPPPPPPPGGNDNVQLGNGNNTVTAGNGNITVSMGYGSNGITLGDGNDTVQVNNPPPPPPPPPGPPTSPAVYGNDTVIAGNGNDNVQLGDGTNVVVVGNGNDQVRAGKGNNHVSLGNGNSNVQLGDGTNVVVAGSGNNTIQVGNGNNLIVGGLGHDSIQVGNGRNILIDGSVSAGLGALDQALADWVQYGNTAGNVSTIRALLGKVTYNSTNGNKLQAGSGLDWFWETFAKDQTNRKPTDLLN